MLFASTQVTSPRPNDVDTISEGSRPSAEQTVTSNRSVASLDRDDLVAGPESSSAGSSSTKRKSFKLNLFRLRP